MSLADIRRRVGRLQTVIAVDPLPGYPPLTTDEIEALARRAAEGEPWTSLERARVVKQCPIIQGELSIQAYKGEPIVKRYVGLESAWI